jgi:hypothetical protein
MTISVFSIVIIGVCVAGNILFSNGYLFSRLCQPSTTLVRGVFVATFTLSASLLQLCLWEIQGSLQNELSINEHPDCRVRGIAWKIVVRALLADLIVVIPLLLNYTLFMGYIPKGISSQRAHVGLSKGYKLLIPMIPFAVFLYLFYQLGSFLPLPEKSRLFWRVTSRSLTEECVLRVGAMGVTLMAVLSGFGSICAGWETYLTPYRYSTFDMIDGRLVTEADVVRARTSVEMTQDLINEKHRKIEQIENRIYEKVLLEAHLFQSQEVHSFMNRVVNSVRGDSEHQGSSFSNCLIQN